MACRSRALANGERGAPTARTATKHTESKKAIHPTQVKRNERALKRRLNSSREIRLYQPTKKDKSSPKERSRKVESSSRASWKSKFNSCSGGDRDDDDSGSRRQANKKKFEEAATAGKRGMMVKLVRGDWRSWIRNARFAERTRERLDLAITDSAGGVRTK